MSRAVGVDNIAVVGLAGRFPGAATVAQFWRNLCAGVESVSFFSDAELEASGIDTRTLGPNYVRARAILDGAEWFDAHFFGFSPREAELLDPQQRVFLETAWEALEDAGCDPEQFAGSVSVFAGMTSNTYYLSNLHGHPDLLARAGPVAVLIANERDFLATRTSYKLDLRGPSLNINTACSTSLVAVSQACQSLLSYQCDVALAGGVAIEFPQKKGSFYREGGITSSDGHCRAFDERATGLVPGEGVGVVVLRRLSEALADGEHVYAVIRGFAVNNDGAHKVGYTAPSIEGQAEVIALAQAVADVHPETISYIEAHGTGTPLGDPIEIAALIRAFREHTNARGFCAIGSVKTNIGHLDAAAGVAGLIKTVLALHHAQLPASLHFTRPNSQIDFANSPFFVNDRLRDWHQDGGPRRAGVSSFGIGGTNAHLVLEEAPVRELSEPSSPYEILALSAKSESALATMSANLAGYLKAHPDVNIADIAYTLQVGRRALKHRRVIMCAGVADAICALKDHAPSVAPPDAPSHARDVAEAWVGGKVVDWRTLGAGRRHKIPLPTYPFARQRYWVEPASHTRADEPEPVVPVEAESVAESLRTLFQELSGLSAAEVHSATTIAELGLDSLALAQASIEMERRFGVVVGFREIQESFPTFDRLARYLAERQPARTDIAQPADQERSADDERSQDEERSAGGAAQPAPLPAALALAPEQRARVETLIERYTRRTARSKEIAQEHRGHYADPRAAAGFRQQWKEMVYPIVVERSAGATLRDVDGNDYIDLVMGFGANLFGHSPDFVTRALQEQLGRGIEIGPQSPLAGHVAAAICRLTGAERATFCNTGSEAVLAALRIARATTTRDKAVLFAGSYHGIFDEVLARPTVARTRAVPVAAGILPDALANIYVLDYGDARALEFIAEHAHELAAVLVEPVQSRNPELQPGDFLLQLRRLTHDHGVALIFDEIITGFRCHPGGAQAHFGVRADIATYGKVLGGGMPIGVVAGRSRFMDALDGGAWGYGDSSGPARAMTYFAGTFVRHPLAIAAADAVLRRLEAEGPRLQETLNDRTATLARTLGQLLAESGLSMRLGHFASMLFLRPTQPESLESLLFYHLRAHGIHVWEGRPGFLSTAHTDQDLAAIERAFAASLAELTGRTVVPVRSPASIPGRVTLPMTPGQTDLWIAANLATGASLAHSLSFVVHARGPLAPAMLRGALQDLVDRHEALRTTFDAQGQYQYIWDRLAVDVPLRDVSALPPAEAHAVLDEVVAQAAERPLDLEKGPLLRAQIVKLAPAHHALLLTVHHIVVDGSSLNVLLEEIGPLYQARLTGTGARLPPPLAARTYSRLAQEQLPTTKVAAIRQYWLKQFATLPDPLDLPVARPRPAVRSYRAVTESFVLGGQATARLRKVSAGLGCGPMHLLLASYSALVHRLSNSNDFVVGVPAASTLSDAGLRIKGDRSLVGDHVNLLPLRMRHRPEQTFEEHVRSVKELVLDGYECQHFTLGELVSQLGVSRDAGHLPLVSIIFNVDRADRIPTIEGVDTEGKFAPKVFGFFDLAANVTEAGEALLVELTFNTDIFDVEVIRAWLAAWQVLLDCVAAEPGLRVADIPLLSPQDQQVLLKDWNATDCAIPDECVHRRIARRARQTPDAVAIESLTYRELQERTNRLAARLRAAGVGPDTVVGLCVERLPQLPVGLLAILEAGGAYLPLDPALPDERLRFMLADAGAAAVVTQSHLRDRLGNTAVAIDVDESLSVGVIPDAPVNAEVGPDNLAYVIYTSGSTGRPKGVAVEHRALTNLVQAMQREIDFTADDVWLAVTTISFDIAALELLLPLVAGGRVALATRETAGDGRALVRALRTTGATVMQATPATWRMLLDAGWEGATQLKVLCGGEALPPGLAHELRVRTKQVWNLYGPSETTIYSAGHRLIRDDEIVPIGRPLANTRIHILGPQRELVPVGVPGDLFIGGAGLARGYLGRPDLTLESFLLLPLGGAAPVRLYRTGDRARYRADGAIEFLGRHDHQVKLRGFRIELGEIEVVLDQHPAVAQSVVVLREDRPGDRRLVAYAVSTGHAALDVPGLTRHLRTRLPDYMVPSTIVPLETLPLTASGKVDRRILPAPDMTRPQLPGGYLAPRTPIEEQLVSLWCEVLGMQGVGVDDDFFALGGHSLLAVRVAARTAAVLEVDLPVRTVFEAPTIAELAVEIDRLRSGTAQESVPPLERIERPLNARLPLSFAQQRLWFLEQMEGELTAYNVPTAWRLRGPLNPEALEQAIEAVIARHEPLRTTFAVVDDAPVQIIGILERWQLPREDLSGLTSAQRAGAIEKRYQAEAERPFDLTRDLMLRASLLRLAADDHMLLLTLHHIAVDGWSLSVLWRELAQLYAARCRTADAGLADLPVRYADYAAWQRDRLHGEHLAGLLQYWRRQLEALPALELPTDRPRPPRPSYRGERYSFVLGPDLIRPLQSLGQAEGVTLHMLLLAAFQTLLSRYSGQDDIAVGTPTAGRTHAALDHLIGVFVNTLVLRADLAGDPTFRELLRRVRQASLSAYDHQDLPFEKLVEELRPPRHLSRSPLVQVMFQFFAFPEQGMSLPGLEVSRLPDPGGRVRFDLEMHLWRTAEGGEGLRGTVVYSTDLFDVATIERLVGHFVTLLEGIVGDANQRVSQLPVLTQAERHRLLVEWNDTSAAYPSDTCVHALFEEQAQRTPHATAVVFEDQQLSYRALNARANQVAHHLRRLGVGPDVPVGICVERSLDMVIGLLAILKAGGAYVPLDAAYPRERLAVVLEDAGVSVLLAHRPTRAAIPAATATIVLVDADESPVAGESEENPPPQGSADDLAYVVYTSGSTGAPKGVCVPHRAVVRLVRGANYVALDPNEVFLQFAPLSFDAATFEIWAPLLNGGRLVVFPPGLPSLHDLGRAVKAHRITTLWLTAGLFHEMVDSELESLQGVRQLLAGGDVLSVPHVRKLLLAYPTCSLINGYGPTENTTFSCSYAVADPSRVGLSVPIGRPNSNSQAYVLDRWRQPVPIGVPGELYVGGDGLARGYLNRPDLTAERFMASPFRVGARLYKTGDRVRWQADGNLEFLGRLDQQVKVRGFRVELGEVEAALRQHPDVRETVALVREDAPGEKRLVAYLTSQDGKRLLASDLRMYLRRKLPEHMVPAAFQQLDTLPLTRNGKVDRRALPAPDAAGQPHVAYSPPRTSQEQSLATIWATVLGLERVGIHDNFFELGGHSLLAVRLFAALEKQCGRRLPVASLFRAPTIAQLTDLLEEESAAAEWSPIVIIQPGGRNPPLFLIPGAGASALGFERLVHHLGPDQPVYGIHARGLDGRQAPHTSVEEMAACYVGALRDVQPHGPYFLVGYSAGGLVTFEMARQLDAAGQEVGLVGLLDAFGGSQYSLPLQSRLARWARFQLRRIRRHRRGFSQARGWEKLDYLGRKSRSRMRRMTDWLNARAPADEEEMSRALRSVREGAVLAETRYVPQRYPGRLTLFRAADQPPTFDHAPEEGWKEIAAGGVDIRNVPGTHYSMLSEPNVAVLAQELAVRMRAARPGDTNDQRSNRRLARAASN